MKRAVVLLSGGLDSATVAALAARSFEVWPLTIDYDQRHSVELFSAAQVARSLDLSGRHYQIHLPMKWAPSALTDPAIDVPTEESDGIPATYVPGRNTVFLALAVSYAESIGARDVFIGVSSVDYSGYPDCRPEYIAAWNRLAALATKEPVRIHAPLVHASKADTIRLGRELGVNYDLTSSCYQPIGGAACGNCDSCRIRAAAFAEVNG